uniref:CSN8/PSMD8/EIF3K domain-containing protein n=1 Tax=Prymnesium polylepis TaxID=72548 RepID=A0A7S4I965_9EUKA
MTSIAPLAEIEKLINANDIAGTAALCESFELDLCHSDETQPISLTVYKVHLLAYLLTNQVNAARFLWKRLAPEIRADAELAALWEVGKQKWLKQPAEMQQALRSFSWSQPLVAALVSKLQEDELSETFKAVGAAYSLISVPVLAQVLGVPEATAHDLANTAGWRLNAESGFYTPVGPPNDKQRRTSLAQLQSLTDFVAHVEYEVG